MLHSYYSDKIFKASFGNRKKAGSSTDFNPYFGTDYGICSIIKPQTAFKPELGQHTGPHSFLTF